LGGLNTYFTGGTFSELLETFEEGCQMSFLVSAMLVQKLKEAYDDAEQNGVTFVSGMREPIVTTRKIMDFGD